MKVSSAIAVFVILGLGFCARELAAQRVQPIVITQPWVIQLFKLVWDAIGTEFGGRHKLYENNNAGNHEQIRVDM
jgi:hypothetical protein